MLVYECGCALMFLCLGRWLYFTTCCPRQLSRPGPLSCGVTKKSWALAGKVPFTSRVAVDVWVLSEGKALRLLCSAWADLVVRRNKSYFSRRYRMLDFPELKFGFRSVVGINATHFCFPSVAPTLILLSWAYFSLSFLISNGQNFSASVVYTAGCRLDVTVAFIWEKV